MLFGMFDGSSLCGDWSEMEHPVFSTKIPASRTPMQPWDSPRCVACFSECYFFRWLPAAEVLSAAKHWRPAPIPAVRRKSRRRQDKCTPPRSTSGSQGPSLMRTQDRSRYLSRRQRLMLQNIQPPCRCRRRLNRCRLRARRGPAFMWEREPARLVHDSSIGQPG
jgi:hypothetical protein